MEKIKKVVSKLKDANGETIVTEFWSTDDIANKVNEIIEIITNDNQTNVNNK